LSIVVTRKFNGFWNSTWYSLETLRITPEISKICFAIVGIRKHLHFHKTSPVREVETSAAFGRLNLDFGSKRCLSKSTKAIPVRKSILVVLKQVTEARWH
jgi:hypothetical protein